MLVGGEAAGRVGRGWHAKHECTEGFPLLIYKIYIDMYQHTRFVITNQ